MKHSMKVTLMIVFLFFISQVIGLAVTNQYIDHQVSTEGNVTWVELPMDISRPEIEEGSAFIYIISAILVGTIIFLLLIKARAMRLWKLWFFLAVLICLTISFGAFLPHTIGLILAFILALIKIYKPNVIIHNMTEVFVYGGLAAVFVPVLNIFAVSVLLILISFYDMYAVWQSKHMVTLAKFQSESKIFAGLLIPYSIGKGKVLKKSSKKASKKLSKKATKKKDMVPSVKAKSAILGGGDIGFPLIFAGVVMKELMMESTVLLGFLKTLIIPVVVSFSLFYLLFKAEENKFYPAMPFLSIGCLLGYIIVLLV